MMQSVKLWDINEIGIESVKNKSNYFADDINGVSLEHLNNGYTIRVHFSDTNYSATDALKDYLKQISRLQF